MSTDLHDRLHESMVSAEIPPYPHHLVEGTALRGRRTRRRRRALGTLTASAAVAAVTVAAALVQGPPAPEQVVPIPATRPTPTGQSIQPTTWPVVEGRLQVRTGIRVDGRAVVLVPEVHAPEGRSVVELVAKTSPRASESDRVSLADTSVAVAEDDKEPGWTVAAVIDSEARATGEFVVYGFLPDDATDVRLDLGEEIVTFGGGLVTAWSSDAMPEDPPAWGGNPRTVFAVSLLVPGLEGEPVDVAHPDVPGLQVESGAVGREWVEVPRS